MSLDKLREAAWRLEYRATHGVTTAELLLEIARQHDRGMCRCEGEAVWEEREELGRLCRLAMTLADEILQTPVPSRTDS